MANEKRTADWECEVGAFSFLLLLITVCLPGRSSYNLKTTATQSIECYITPDRIATTLQTELIVAGLLLAVSKRKINNCIGSRATKFNGPFSNHFLCSLEKDRCRCSYER